MSNTELDYLIFFILTYISMHNLVIAIFHSKTDNSIGYIYTVYVSPRGHRTIRSVFAFFNVPLLNPQHSMCKRLRLTKFQQSHERSLLKSAVQMHANYRTLQST